MDRRTEKRFDMKFYVVSILCFIGAGVGGYFLYQDLTSSGGAGQGKPMAKLERKEAKVRRKASTSYVWSNANNDEDLYRRDSIQTGIASAAAVRLADGTLLEVGENSLIVIDDLQNLALNTGQLIVRSATGDSRITVGKDGKTRIEQLPVRLVKPEPLAVLFSTEKDKDIQFTWEPRAGAKLPTDMSGVKLEISKDKSFKTSSVASMGVTDINAKSLPSKLAAGKYFWRIADKGESLTEVGQFRVAMANPLKPSFPASGGKVLMWEQDTSAQFRWVVPQSPEVQEELALEQVTHKIEIASDLEFKRIIVSQDINALSGLATLKDLPAGASFWRISSKYADVAVQSQPEKFVVERAQKLALELNKPEENAALELKPQLRFAWTSDSHNVEYELELRTQDDKEVFKQKVNTQQFVWKNVAGGSYKYKVTALYQDKPVGETAWRPFAVFSGQPLALVTPQKDQQIYYWDSVKHFDFEWKKDPLVNDETAEYQLEVSPEADFKQIVANQKLKSTSVSSDAFKLVDKDKFANFYWRVKIVNQTGQLLKVSEPSKFTYGMHPPLRAPASAKPDPGYERNLVSDPGEMKLSWSEVEGAESYEVYFFDPAAAPSRKPAGTSEVEDDPSGKIAFKTTVEKNSLTLSPDQLKNIPAEKYVWAVRPIDKLKRKGHLMDPRQLTLTYGDMLAPPEITSPEVQ